MNLVPITTRRNAAGHVEVGGYDLTELADRFGTPLLVLDEETIRQQARLFTRTLAEAYPNSQVIYANKALSLVAVLAILRDEGIGADVVSSGELQTARKAKVPGPQIYFHGNNKSVEELRQLTEIPGATVVIDNFREIELLSQLKTPVRALLRVTPGIECHTHEYIKTGHLDSKFGFDPSYLDLAVQYVSRAGNIQLKGLHCHIGSQIFETRPYCDAAKVMLKHYADLSKRYSLPFEELNLGGGFGIKHTEAEDPPEIQDVLRSITATIKGLLWEYDLGHEPKLVFEPGRSIIGPAGVSLYRVGSRKQVPGGKYYLAVDGGMADNPRPTTYSADYSAELVGSNHGDKLEEYTIAGRYCESGDILIDAVHLPGDVKENDLLMIPATGGYCYAMASNYNRSLRPAVVLVSQGEAEVIRERESLEAMLRGDLLPTRLEAELV